MTSRPRVEIRGNDTYAVFEDVDGCIVEFRAVVRNDRREVRLARINPPKKIDKKLFEEVGETARRALFDNSLRR